MKNVGLEGQRGKGKWHETEEKDTSTQQRTNPEVLLREATT